MASAPDEQNIIDSDPESAEENPPKSPKEIPSVGNDSNSTPTINISDDIETDESSVNLFGGNHPVSICSPFSLQNSSKPVFGSSRSILKPSTLFTDANVPSPSVTFGNNASKSVKLKPSVLSNPFVNSKVETNHENQVSDCDDSKTMLPNSEKPDSTNDDSNNTVKTTSTPVFVPLSNPTSSNTNTSAVTSTTNNTATLTVSNNQSTAETTSNTPSSTSASTEFVFGQNLHERVTMKNENPEPVTQNGITSSEMLFSSALKQDSSSTHEFSNGNTKTLSVSAKEYEEARSVKRKYEEVAVVTGEEDEQNVLQINCKLYAFDNTLSSWSERGRGTLRVNDGDSSTEGRSSRLIMRLLGNLRVVLNTKVWSGMTVELASKNSVRLTAIDNDGQVRIYLVTANPKDSEQLYNVLTNRIQKKKLKTSSEEGVSKTTVDV